MSGDKHFNCDKIFVLLFLATALEVTWGYVFGPIMHSPKWVLWGGLLLFAAYKGILIAIYFMHLKFEGWGIWALLLPTPFLMCVLFGYVLPDIANGDSTNNLVHPIGAMVDAETGVVQDHMWWTPEEHEAGHGAGHKAPSSSDESAQSEEGEH